MRILLLEDDRLLGSGLKNFLQAEGHSVDWFSCLGEVGMVVDEPYDVMLVDWQLPDGSGLDWVRQVRRRRNNTPVLVLTAKDRLSDRIQGLDSGADDYLIKPFEPEELLARIRAVRRRAFGQKGDLCCIGQVEIDFQNRSVLKGGIPVVLTAREWSVLEALATRAGRVVSKMDLDALVAGSENDNNSNALEVHVSNLRRKLGKDVVLTVRGFGYKIGA